MKYKINDYITLKLEGQRTVIYVKGQRFLHCKLILIEIPVEKVENYEDFSSIDEFHEIIGNSVENRQGLTREAEFWGHSSNLQAWAEHGYDTCLLHRTIAFPLLKKLSDIGDPVAKEVFKGEILKRFVEGTKTVFIFLLHSQYLDYLTKDEMEVIFTLENFIQAFQEELSKNKFHGKKYYYPFLKRAANMDILIAKDMLRDFILNDGTHLDFYVFFQVNGYFEFFNDEDLDLIVPNATLQEELKVIQEISKKSNLEINCIKEKEFMKNFTIATHYSSESRFFIRDNYIQGLYLIGQHLRQFPKGIFKLKQLKYLYLGKCVLNNIPTEINQLKNLKSLYFESINLKRFPDSICSMETLEDLNLFNNEIVNIPDCIGNLKNLRKLDLSWNSLKSIPVTIGKLELLEDLDLGTLFSGKKNSLDNLPKSIGNLKSLKKLNLENNDLKVLPKGICNLTKLENLDIRKNKLEEIPDSIGNLKSLTSLDVSQNCLSVIPVSIGNLEFLERFHLNQNSITFLPESFGDLKSLKFCSVSNNPLKSVPKSIARLPTTIIASLERDIKENLRKDSRNFKK